jgi:hypothetical protein
MRKSRYFVIVLVFLFACSKQTPLEGEIYFPQGSEGSKWEYFMKYISSSGTKKERLSITTMGKESINGKKYNKQVSLLSGQQGEKTHVSYNRRDRNGIYWIDLMNKDKPEYIATPFPMTIGKTWTVMKSDGRVAYRAEKIENVKYLGRTYKNCLKVTYHGDTMNKPLEGFTYYAPHVGEVFTVIAYGDVGIEFALDRYTQ